MKKIRVRISDNVLEEKDWTVYELKIELYKGSPTVMAMRALNLGVYGQDLIGFTLDQLSEWLCWDPTGHHPEVWHEIWTPTQDNPCYESGLSVDELRHLLEVV
jgi:hypothetical protein